MEFLNTIAGGRMKYPSYRKSYVRKRHLLHVSSEKLYYYFN